MNSGIDRNPVKNILNARDIDIPIHDNVPGGPDSDLAQVLQDGFHDEDPTALATTILNIDHQFDGQGHNGPWPSRPIYRLKSGNIVDGVPGDIRFTGLLKGDGIRAFHMGEALMIEAFLPLGVFFEKRQRMVQPGFHEVGVRDLIPVR